MYKIKSIRGTIFCNPVKYAKELVVGLSDILKDYLPVLVRDGSLLPILPVWQMMSQTAKKAKRMKNSFFCL